MQPRLYMCLFGNVRLMIDGRSAEPFKTLKSRDLLAFLALFPGRVHERLTLQNMLWPDVDVLKSQNRLSVTLYLLRQALEESGIRADDILETSRETLCLREGAVMTDQAHLVRLSDVARERPEEAESMYRELVELYTGPLLGTASPHWANAMKVDAEIRFQEALEWLADRLKPPHEPRALLHRFLEVDPTSERAGAMLIDWLLRNDMARDAYAYAVQFAYDARRNHRELGPLLRDSVQRALAYRQPSASEGVTSVCSVQGVSEQKLDQVCEGFVAYRPSGMSVFVPDPLVARRLAARLLAEEPLTTVVINTFIGGPGNEPKPLPKGKPGEALADLPSAALLKSRNESYVVGAVGAGYYSVAIT